MCPNSVDLKQNNVLFCFNKIKTEKLQSKATNFYSTI